MDGTRKAVNTSTLVFVLFALAVSAQGLEVEREVIYLSGMGKDDAVVWDFFCTSGLNSGKWATIPVPSNWECHGFGGYNYGHDRNKSGEQGKYRRRFEIPTDWEGNRIFIVFEGAMTDTEVWVNGKSAGPVHQGGFYRFKYEVTKLVKAGDNLLEVTVSKVSSNRRVEAAERSADYWVFGGIYRPVYLKVVPSEFIEWTAVDARADGEFSIDVHLNSIRTAKTVRAVITEEDGKKICKPFGVKVEPGQEKVTLSAKVKGHKLWTAETPNLYKVQVTMMEGRKEIHAVEERFGFRTFEVRAGDGLYLNGQKIRLKGVNRHSFWPDSGRCLSRKISYDDVRLIKEMNMNAVRMSHYPPDVHFLDACDELGLYVLDELAGWQRPPYDTKVGKELVKEMVIRDVSHPCILFWDNGNEGGWNGELDGEFALYDPQKRVVLHPWEKFNGIDTDHYENYRSVQRKLNGSTLFMPTELLHGLYDGGHGAGLNDYWKLMYSSNLGAGIFLWALTDEGAVRTDKNGRIDVAGNLAPDGIVGPYRQKEGSFYAIKEIWSPVHISLERLGENFNGRLKVENRYDFTNLQDCVFTLRSGEHVGSILSFTPLKNTRPKSFKGPDIEPHGSGIIELPLPKNWRQSSILYLTVNDPYGREIWTWSWDTRRDDYYSKRYVRTEGFESPAVTASEMNGQIRVQANNLVLRFSKSSGELILVNIDGRNISLSKGPRLTGDDKKVSEVEWSQDVNDIVVNVGYKGDGSYVNWRIYPTGWVKLDYQFELKGKFNLFGVNFDYPESKMKSMRWLGRGPYRVWKNRTKGGKVSLWVNDYKDDVPGGAWDFPEFKGYYKDWRWVVFSTIEGRIIIINETDDLYLGVYKPNDGHDPMNTELDAPESGIALLHGIPAIGTKFLGADELGPESQKSTASGLYKGTVYFRFVK